MISDLSKFIVSRWEVGAPGNWGSEGTVPSPFSTGGCLRMQASSSEFDEFR